MRRINILLLGVLISLFSIAVSAATIAVNVGDDIAAICQAASGGDIIELQTVGTYTWNQNSSSTGILTAGNLTIQAKAGLASRPTITFTQTGVTSAYWIKYAPTSGGTLTVTGIDWDANNSNYSKYNNAVFLIGSATSQVDKLIVDNCQFRRLMPATGGVFDYQGISQASGSSLTVTNSTFLNANVWFDKYVTYSAHPTTMSFTNCLFSGATSSGATLDSRGDAGLRADNFTLNHCTFTGGSKYLNLGGSAKSVTITNCLFVNGSTASAYTGTNLTQGYNGIYPTASQVPFLTATYTDDPVLDGSGYATTTHTGNDGKNIGYYNTAAPTPVVNVSATTKTGFTYVSGSGPSSEQSFTVGGTNLTGNITVTAPTNYEISTGTGVSFSATSPIALTPSSGTVATTTIYVRLKAGLSAANYNTENIVVASTGVTDQNVVCSGSVTAAATPVVTVSTSTLTGFSYVTGAGPSSEQSFTVSGTNLSGNISLTAPTNYEISTGTGGSFAATSPITLTQSVGTVLSTTIYVRLKAGLAIASYNSENIAVASTGVTTQNVACSGTVNDVPSTAVTPTTRTGFTYSLGVGPSATQTITVSGGNLQGNITLAPPTNYEISLSSGSGFVANPSTLTLTPSSGTLASTSVYIRLKAGLAVGNYDNEDIVCTTSNATTKNVTCSGSVTSHNPLIQIASGDVGAAVASAISGDIIELTTSGGSYTWGTAATFNTATTITVRAAAGLAARPIITNTLGGTPIVFNNYNTFNLSGVEIQNAAVNRFIFVGNYTDATYAYTNKFYIDNCKISGLGVYGLVSATFNYSTLSITNSIFSSNVNSVGKWTGYAAKPYTLTVTNCLFKGNSGSNAVFVWDVNNPPVTPTFSHCTFQNNTAKDLDLNAAKVPVITNSLFVGSSQASIVGTDLNVSNVGIYPAGNTSYFSTSGASTLIADPALDANGYATASAYLGTGTDGKNIGYYNIAAPTISTTGTLSAVNTTYGTASASPATFSVSGVNMLAGILVTPPSGYEVSLASGSDYASTVTVGAAGTISSTPIYVRLAATTAVGSHSGNIVLSSTGATSANVATVSSSVAAKALTITADNQSVAYGTTDATVIAAGTYTPTGFVNGELAGSVISGSVTYSTNYDNTTAASASGVTITPIVTELTATNYSFTAAAGTITVTKATPTITVSNSPVTYDGSTHSATATALGGGVVSNISTGGAATQTNVGTYTVTADIAESTNYNAATSVTASNSFVISKATPTITVSNTPLTYDGSTHSATATALGGGVVSNISTGGAATQTNAGTYTVTADIAESTNYNAATSVTASNSFVIDKASQSITFSALPTGKTVGDADFAPGATSATSGTTAITYSSSDAAVATIVSSQIHLVGAGTCTIYANQALSDNYNAATQASQSITVTAASSTVDVATSHNSGDVISGTTSDVTVSGTAVLTVNGAGCEVKSLATATGTQVIVNSPLVVNTGGVTLAPSSTFEVANTVDVTGNVEVGAGANLKFTTADPLNVTGDLILKATETTSFSLNLGSSSVVPTGNVRYIKTIDDQKWYFISFPCDIAISGIRKADGSSMGVLGAGGSWFIKYYDSSRRASQGTTNGTNWIGLSSVDYTAEPISFKLIAKQGYIIGIAGNTHATVDVAFPITKSYLANETDVARTKVPVIAFTGAKSNDNGWTLIGQPYLSKFSGIDADVNYMLFSDGTSTYTTCSRFNGTLATKIVDPFTAYFVQETSRDIAFTTTGRQGVKSLVAQSLTQLVQLNMTTPTGTDYTSLILDDAQSTAYQIGQDMEKWIGTGTAKPQVYTVLGGVNYDFNALPISSVNNLPLGIYTQTTGSTTISVDATKATSLSKLLLLENGVVVADLLTTNYTFTAVAGTNNTRFSITAQRVVTDNNVIGNELGEAQMIINNTKLIINNLDASTTVRVFDALGRMVVSKNANSNSMEIKLSVQGIYTVQLQKGTTLSTKKVIF